MEFNQSNENDSTSESTAVGHSNNAGTASTGRDVLSNYNHLQNHRASSATITTIIANRSALSRPTSLGTIYQDTDIFGFRELDNMEEHENRINEYQNLRKRSVVQQQRNDDPHVSTSAAGQHTRVTIFGVDDHAIPLENGENLKTPSRPSTPLPVYQENSSFTLEQGWTDKKYYYKGKIF
jgi:hypothetical protein